MAEQDRYLHPNGETTSNIAFDLHVAATARSAAYDHPGFIPDAQLDSLTDEFIGHTAADLAGLAAELCAARVWKAADGGYRVLDAEAVEVCADRVRELRGEPKPPPARLPGRQRPPARATPEGITRHGQPAARGRGASFRCARCGELAGLLRVVRPDDPPGSAPAPRRRARGRGGLALEHFLDDTWRPAGTEILDAVQELIGQGEVDPAAIRELEWGFWALTPFYCPDCELNYCSADWDITRGQDEDFREPAMGRCPAGHEHMVDEDLTPEPEKDPERTRHLDGSETFDGQDHVISAAAWDLHLGAAAHSAHNYHPGLVPDECLADLGPDAASTATQLAASGVWERADGGYRIHDPIMLETMLDRVSELRHHASRINWLSVRTEQELVLRNAREGKSGR